MEFEEFPKIARFSREIFITEKIDGTNGAVVIEDGLTGVEPFGPGFLCKVDNMNLYAQSKNRFITPADDNFGFAKWVMDHAKELVYELGVGRHYGEWWGRGVQRRYDLTEKRFSLFNVSRWTEHRPACCHVVPTLYQGPMDQDAVDGCLTGLRTTGSVAAPGFMKPEGVIIYHTAARMFFKKTLEKDELHKSQVKV